jgi:hypothetical protein
MERTDPAEQGPELQMLGQFLDYHRATLVQKASGLSRDQLAAVHPPSALTLIGLLKHAALNENHWFGVVLLGEAMPEPFASAPWDDDVDWELSSAPSDDPAYVFDLYATACDRSRAALARVGDLDALSAKPSRQNGEQFTARWIVLHMIEETARHNGHADLIRESIDGLTGE